MKVSQSLYVRSQQCIPGGVNSPVRSFSAVGGNPIFINRGLGAYLIDCDERRYIDLVCSWGAIIVGHSNHQVIEAISQALADGLGFGAPTERECLFAESLCAALPKMDKVRAVSSGTEATMSAIRLARGFTGRDKVVKFRGCYHGHSDALLTAAGSGVMTLGLPACAGVTKQATADTIVLPYNDSQALIDCFAQQGDSIATVIVEPIAGNMNLVPSKLEFLQTLRQTCNRYKSVLIFDEVMSGFRVHRQSAQGLYNVHPDLTCLGKVIGGGLNVAVFGGRQDIMDYLAPMGNVYQAGTLSGNPVALAAGLATLQQVLAPDFFERLEAMSQRLSEGLSKAAQGAGVSFCARAIGGMIGLYFCPTPPDCLEQISDHHVNSYRQFFHAMLRRGVYLAPSAYEANFIGIAHTQDIVDDIIRTATDAFADMAKTSAFGS